jgi:hypothetical protein
LQKHTQFPPIMKKPLLLIAAGIFVNGAVYAQACNMILKDGQKVKLNIKTWTNPLTGDAKFTKAKEDAQTLKIAAYNEGVQSGTTPATSAYPMVYTAKKSDVKDAEEYALRTEIAGKNYYSYVVCKDDTMYLARNRGPIEVPDGKGGIYGYTIQGVQKLPLKMQVGDILPSYSDITIVFPTSTTDIVKHKVFSHYSSSTSNESGFFVDSRTGESGIGPYTKTTTSAVYNTIDVEVKKTLSSNGHTINYALAKVTGEQEMSVGGTKYKAFIIDSESWTKQVMNASFESANEEVNRAQQAQFEKGQQWVEKLMKKKGYNNDLGYAVMYKREWFVPGLGAVKTQSFDMFGGILGEITIDGLE